MPPFVPDTYSPGGEDEAVICVADTMSGWTDTPGALEWLDEIVASRMPRRRARGTGKSKSTPKPKSQKAASKKGKRPKHEPPHGESDP
jgi:hypothetical protein